MYVQTKVKFQNDYARILQYSWMFILFLVELYIWLNFFGCTNSYDCTYGSSMLGMTFSHGPLGCIYYVQGQWRSWVYYPHFDMGIHLLILSQFFVGFIGWWSYGWLRFLRDRFFIHVVIMPFIMFPWTRHFLDVSPWCSC